MSAAATSRHLGSTPTASRARSATAAPSGIWHVWARRILVRRALAALHPDQAREAGLDAYAVRRESLKPFWRA